MNQQPQYRGELFTIEPYGNKEISRSSEFITCLDATRDFRLSFDDAPATRFEKGLGYQAQVPFNKVRIENPHNEVITISIGMGRGGLRDARFVASGSIATSFDAPPFADTVESVSCIAGASTLIAASDPRRKELIVRNLSEDADVWLRGDSGTVAGGYLIKGGEGAVLGTSGQIYAFNSGAVAVALSGLSVREQI